MTWMTNNPEAAELLRQADARYAAARKGAENLPLVAKVAAYGLAQAQLVADYHAVNMAGSQAAKPLPAQNRED
jgi:hypothetical protein